MKISWEVVFYTLLFRILIDLFELHVSVKKKHKADLEHYDEEGKPS